MADPATITTTPMDAYDTHMAGKPKAAGSVLEAFANTARALQQFGLERIRVVGLSKDCISRPAGGFDSAGNGGIRVVTEQEFMRDFVFLSRPCVIVDAMEDWPAMTEWRSDRYLFDLNGRLPLVEQRSTSSDDDEDEEDDKDDGDGWDNKEKNEDAKATGEEAAEPRPLGPRRFTIALTPNGRADAVTYLLYDTRDVPEDRKDDVYTGRVAAKAAVMLKDHPALHTNDERDNNNTDCNHGDDDDDDDDESQFLRMEKVFMYATEVKITLPELYTLLLRGPKHILPSPVFVDMRAFKHNSNSSAGAATPAIAYAQLQNNCLNTEFSHVHTDITTNIQDFGARVFGEPPEAANVWFGVPASVSSMHQDWVENLYSVVRGVKKFILIPPWEGFFVPKPDVPSAQFSLDPARSDKGELRFAFRPYPEKDGTVVPWMDFDFNSDLLEGGKDDGRSGKAAVLAALNEQIADCESRKDPRLRALSSPDASSSGGGSGNKLKELHPIVARVHPGETLYLPAMWLHRVGQNADERDIRARARAMAEERQRGVSTDGTGIGAAVDQAKEEEDGIDNPPLPLIAAVNYWYNMNFANPAVVMLQQFGLLL